MNKKNNFDVIIIGAGPVGLLTANLLGKGNIKVLIIEKETGEKESSKAIGITPPSLKVLKSINLDKEFIKSGVKINKAVVCGTKKILGDIFFSNLKNPYNFILSIPQNTTESILEKNAKRQKNITLKKGYEAVGLVIKEDFSDVEAKNIKTKKSEFFSARHIVAADGKKSFTRNFLKIPYKGDLYKDTFLMADFLDKSGFGNEARLFFTKNGPVESFPLPKNRRRWVISTDKFLKKPAKGFLESEVYKRTGYDLRMSKKLSESPFGVGHFIIKKYFYENSVLFCGDAAHVMSPIGGQGMNTGFGDAEFCAHVLKIVLKEKSKACILFKEYDRYRRIAAKNATARARISMFIGTLSGGIISGIRNFLIYVFVRIAKNVIPPYFAMLTIRYGSYEKINDKKMFSGQ